MMILQATGFGGALDISSPEALGDPNVVEYRRVVRNGDVFTVPNSYGSFPNIKNAISTGYLIVLDAQTPPGTGGGGPSTPNKSNTISGVSDIGMANILAGIGTGSRTVTSIILQNASDSDANVELSYFGGAANIQLWDGVLSPGDSYIADSSIDIALESEADILAVETTAQITYIVTYEENSGLVTISGTFQGETEIVGMPPFGTSRIIDTVVLTNNSALPANVRFYLRDTIANTNINFWRGMLASGDSFFKDEATKISLGDHGKTFCATSDVSIDYLATYEDIK